MWRVYSDIRSSTDDMYEEVEGQDQRREQSVDVDSGEDPFSILLLGLDTGEFGREEQGRSDSIMIMTVNPNTDQATMISVPRDTYTEIIGRGTEDKINHAYAFGGVPMTINTVQNLFNFPVDYYVSVNMEAIQEIIDSIGGIEITPPLTFTHTDFDFVKGQQTHMDGARALAYSRMRYDDPRGDYGRQERQREVLETTIKKFATLDSILNYRTVLDSLSSNMQTNLSFDDIVDVFSKYSNSANNIEQVQLTGSGRKVDGGYYEFIPDEEVERVSSILKTELEIN
ncbi:LCP family protein [Marinilactibacillus sp. Marseille-P9653]|uniref:LCP family glycopolymer transferase n=1 Tax=Marinilactibacillus sp. Marseille-P9653 TaxID=2866583 RepID=UPI001CE41E38|nr:LCP family protein [Marinilactibacillus sp. Marseille-P9653]